MVANNTIPKLHFENQLWINELNFYKEETKLFEDYLANLSFTNNSKEAAVGVEHFQNQFIIQKDIIDQLKHELGVSERRLVAFVKELSDLGLNSIRIDNNVKLRERMKAFREMYSDLKLDFRRFESEWL